MKKIIVLLVVSIITFSSCDKDDVSKNIESIEYTVDYQQYLHASKSDNFGDPFEIDNVLKLESILSIDVKYGGGCQEHSFEIIWDGTMINSNPPTVKFILVHNANNDMCEAYLSEKLKIDLNELMAANYVSELNVTIINGYNKEIYDEE